MGYTCTCTCVQEKKKQKTLATTYKVLCDPD